MGQPLLEQEPTSVEVVTLTIPRGSLYSAPHDVVPQYSVPNGPANPEMPHSQVGEYLKVVRLVPVEVVDLAPKTKDEDGNDITGSEKPNSGKPLTPFVEVDPNANKIAHREIKVKIGDALKDKKVTWTLEALPGATPATIRGDWDKSPNHKDRFEASTAYDASSFRKVSQTTGETKVGADGHTAIRVNVPPIGFNQVRIKIQIEGMSTPIDLIDMEVPGVVVIDPGHGGDDSGAVGAGGVQEKDLALACGLSLRQQLLDKFANEKHGVRVVMTRDNTDDFPSLTRRPQIAKEKGADIFVSIHFNSGGASARGTETFVERTQAESQATSDPANNPGNNQNQAEDMELATALNTTTLNAVAASDAGAINRGVKREGKMVTRDGVSLNGNTQDYHPVKACLIEVEFLSNATALETIKLSNPSGVAIKDAFAENGATDVFNNIRNQQ
jgi:N-acetylmuramoyl-L-alanine amidase